MFLERVPYVHHVDALNVGMILWLSGCYKSNLYTVTDGKKKSRWRRGSTELHFCENIIELSLNNALTSYDKTTFIFILRDSIPKKIRWERNLYTATGWYWWIVCWNQSTWCKWLPQDFHFWFRVSFSIGKFVCWCMALLQFFIFPMFLTTTKLGEVKMSTKNSYWIRCGRY